AIEATIRRSRIRNLILSGVRSTAPDSVIIDDHVQIAEGVSIGPDVQLLGRTIIGKGVTIEGSAYLNDVVVDDGATLFLGVRATSCRIGSGATVGPFAHLRPGSVLGREAKIGNFVETKEALLGDGV